MDINELLYEYVEEKIGKVIIKDFRDYYNAQSQKDQILFYFKLEGQLNSSDVSEEFKDFQVKTLINRLCNCDHIKVVDKEGKFLIYKITSKGLDYLKRKMNAFLDNNYKYKDYLSNKRKEKLNEKETDIRIKTIIGAILDKNIRPNEEDNIIINMKELAEWKYEATELIYANMKDSLIFIKEYFINDIDELKDENIKFINVHENIFKPIHHINRETEELIFTKGLVTSKKESIVSKTLFMKWICSNPNCNLSEKDKAMKTKLPIKKCPKCKSSVELIHEEKINKLESKITDVESGISFHLELHGSLATEFSYIDLGDEIEVIGYLQDKNQENSKGQKEMIKIIVVNNFNTTDYIKELTKEEVEEIERLIEKNQEIKEYLLKPFSNYIEQDFIKELIIAQQLTKFDESRNETPLNFAIMGEPGVGKNELIKIAENYFPTCDSIVGADITDAGFKGTVNRETGIKEVGLAKKCQGGTIFFNEFDKFIKTNPNGKKGGSQLLNASITEQEIRLNKAGIRIRMRHLDLRHNIMFNPLDEKIVDEQKIKYNHMGEIMDKSLLSRMIPIYIGKDKERSEKVFDVMIKNEKKLNDIKPTEYKLLIRYLRSKEVEFTKSAEEKLKEVYKEILSKDIYEVISVERIGLMLIQLCKAIARLNNTNKITKKIVKYSCDLYFKCLKTTGITYENMDQLFLEKPVKEIKTIYEIKQFIKNEFDNKINYILLEDLEKLFDKETLIVALEELKKDGQIFEPRKNEIRRLK